MLKKKEAKEDQVKQTLKGMEKKKGEGEIDKKDNAKNGEEDDDEDEEKEKKKEVSDSGDCCIKQSLETYWHIAHICDSYYVLVRC